MEPYVVDIVFKWAYVKSFHEWLENLGKKDIPFEGRESLDKYKGIVEEYLPNVISPIRVISH